MPSPRRRTSSSTPETPYVGLVPYGEDDAPFFFGREEEKAIVTANLRAARLTVLYGPSGVGKSSLLLAGVVHDLRASIALGAAEQCERVPLALCVFRSWRDEPLPTLVESIRTAAIDALGGEELPAWSPTQPLVGTLRSWTRRVRTILVVLDQFEDYFLYCSNAAGPGSFDAEFPGIVNEPNLRVNVLVSIREDAWAKLDRFEGRVPELFANYVRVEHLNREAARQAIEKPIGVWNDRLAPSARPYKIEKRLVGAVVEAAASGQLALVEPGNAASQEPVTMTDAVEAPFLQLVMDRLWRATVEAGSQALTLERLQELGGAQQIVETHLSDALGALNSEEQAVAADVFRFLVTRSKTKIAHSASDLAEWSQRPEPEILPVLEKLCRGESGRILRAIAPAGDAEGTRYELFHDVLAEPILDWRKAYEQERERKELAARHEAEELARRSAEAERQRERRQRLIRSSALGLLVLAGVLAALSAFAVLQWRDAVRLKHRANSLLFADFSRSKLGDDPVRAVWEAAIGVNEQPTREADAALENALATTHISSILRGHKAVFSPDERLIATASADGAARIWNGKTGRLVAIVRAGNRSVFGIGFSHDGKRLVTADKGGTAQVWAVPSGRSIAALKPSKPSKAPPAGIYVPYADAEFSHNGRFVLVAGGDGAVRVWEVASRKEVLETKGAHGKVINSAVFSPDGDYIVTASDDGTVRLWATESGAQLKLMRWHGQIVRAVFSEDGRRVVAVSSNGTVRVWRASDGFRVARFGRPTRINCLDSDCFPTRAALSPGGRFALVAGKTGIVKIWNTDTGNALRLRIKKGALAAAAFSADGALLATSQFDGTIRLWDVKNGALIGVLFGHKKRAYRPAFSPDGRLVVAGSADSRAIAWSVRAGNTLAKISGTASALTGAAISRDGTAVVALNHGPARFQQLVPGSKAWVLRGAAEPVYDGAFSPDGRMLATASPDYIRIWNERGRLVSNLANNGLVSDVAFSPDRRFLVGTSQRDFAVRLWNIRTREMRILRPAFGAAKFSADGRLLISSGYQPVVWDVDTGRVRMMLHTFDVASASFSPDGARIITAGPRNHTRIWSLSTGRPVSIPRRLSRPALGATFSPNGKLVATVGLRGVARVWDLRGSLIGVYGHVPVSDAAFSADGKLLVTTGRDGTRRTWNVASHARVALVRSLGSEDYQVAFSPDGRLAALGGPHGSRLLSVASKRTVRRLSGPLGPITSALVDPANSLVVTLSEGVARVWSPSTERSFPLRSPSHVESIALSPHGERLATGGADGGTHVWQGTTGELVASARPAKNKHESITSIAVSPDAAWVASGSDSQGSVRLWNVRTGAASNLKGHREGIARLAFGQDGKFLASASYDNTARIWQIGDSKPRLFGVLRGHTRALNDIAFSADGRSVVTASDDKTSIIWTLRGTSIRVLRGHSDSVMTATFSSDGKLVLTTSLDGTARVWDARTEAPCALLGSSRSPIVGAELVGTGTVVAVSADGNVLAGRTDACAMAIQRDYRRLAQRFIDGLSAAERSKLRSGS